MPLKCYLHDQTVDKEYRHLIPAPVRGTSTSAWSYKHPWIVCLNTKPSTPVTLDIACKSKLRSVVRSGICAGHNHTQITERQSRVRSCSMPKLPTHLMQELNAGTVLRYLHMRLHVHRTRIYNSGSELPRMRVNLDGLYNPERATFVKT